MGFGALLEKNGKIIGRGWNRRSTPQERKLLSHVDYKIDAEQACIADALLNNRDVRGSEVYVLGIVLRGAEKGKLSTRRGRVFICKRCPHTFIRFGIPVNIPRFDGWVKLSPEMALKTAKIVKKTYGRGYWQRFTQKKEK
ncbi:hypothetical protein MYX06_01155 [Patescibacteria group bacterium AH-259-L05]|nr:hypothetical protein [Patescibacteria group bacterium AH-259-L05]